MSDGVKSDYQGSGERVLLVDHDVSIIEAGKRLLEQLGYEAVTCANSTQALALLHSTGEEQIDCVICEVAMPQIGGVAIANTSRLCRPRTRFLLSSGTADVLSPESLRVLGIAGVVMKPFSSHFLARALNRALTGSKL